MSIELLYPVKATSKRISSPYGNRTNPVTKKKELHDGIDIPAALGTPIYAAFNGIVAVSTKDNYGGGNHIAIYHQWIGLYTGYLHCSSISVSKGQTVWKGDIIGYVGSTGNSTGNHLHFSIGNNLNAAGYITDKGSQNPLSSNFSYIYIDQLLASVNQPNTVRLPLFSVRVVCSKLNLRSRPSVSSSWVGSMAKGTIENVYAVEGTWGQREDGKWFSIKPAYSIRI